MNNPQVFAKKLLKGTLLLVMGGLFSFSAHAAVIEIDALFRPDSSAPQKNEFVNMTPSQGFCDVMPQACTPQKLFSLIAPITFLSTAPIYANHEDPRQGGMAKIPSEWRDVLITHQSGKTSTLKIRMAGIGHETRTPLSVAQLTGGGGWDQLWKGGGWVNAPAPCAGVGHFASSTHGYTSFWTVPQGAGVCAKQALYDIPIPFRYSYFVFGYQLITPDPLSMDSGRYQGSVTFGVGPGQDFDMGDLMVPNDSALTLNFNLEVQHTLKVEVPPGGEKVRLVPSGGWQGWLQAGRKPVRLFRDQSFNIWASSPFKMQLDCERSDRSNCLIRDPVSGREAEIEVSVSLPGGLTDMAGQAVNRQPLLAGSGHERQMFQPGVYVDRGIGVLHFEMSPYYVNHILQPGASGRYVGNIAVIWDSEI